MANLHTGCWKHTGLQMFLTAPRKAQCLPPLLLSPRRSHCLPGCRTGYKLSERDRLAPFPLPCDSHLRAPPLLQSTSVQPLVPPHPTSCSRVPSLLRPFHCEVLGAFKISLSLLSLLTFPCLSFHVSKTSPPLMLLILRLSLLDLPFSHAASAAAGSAAPHVLDAGLHGYLAAAPSWDCLFCCCSISPLASFLCTLATGRCGNDCACSNLCYTFTPSHGDLSQRAPSN